MADNTEPGTLAATGYDDDGVACQRWDIIREGRFVGYCTNREVAPRIGQTRSRGSNRADSWASVPIVRIANIGLEPGPSRLDDMIADITRGIYIEGHGSFSIDQRRYNFQFGGDAFWLIENGRRAHMLRDVVYHGITPDFWGRCDAVADASYRRRFGFITCGKGQPGQSGWMTHAASHARFRNISVIQRKGRSMSRQPDDPSALRADGNGLISRDHFRRVVDRVVELSDGQHTFIALHDTNGGTTRFANNQIVQNVNTRRMGLAVTVAFGQQHGTATVTDFGDEAIRDTVRRATQIARVSPADPEYMPPLPPQDYAAISTQDEDTATAGPSHRIVLAAEAVDLCKAGDMTAAGIVTTSLTAVGVAANSGLFAYESRTEARFSLTAMTGDSSGWAANVHRSLDQLGVRERTRAAIDKAKRSASPKELPPGHYTVILEPAAVAGLIGPMIWMLDAKSFYKRTSPFSGKLGRLVIDPRLSLQNRPDHAGLLGNGFNGEGLPADDRVWIERGVLTQLRYDRFTAQEHHVYPTSALDAPCLFGTPLAQELTAEDAAGAGTPLGQDLAAKEAAGVLGFSPVS